MRRIGRVLAFLVGILLVVAVVVRILFGGGRRLEDRTTAPELPGSALEVVVDLDFPPGNVAVSPSGRVFFTFHPDGGPPAHVLELVGGRPTPYPDAAQQSLYKTPLAVRVDRQNRLWVLDHAGYARGQPRLLAFDLATNTLVKRYDFPSSVAGFLSMVNDFQVDPAGERIYIAEASPIVRRPAIIVYDVRANTSRRLLERDRSVSPSDYILNGAGRDIVVLGIYSVRIGIDSITLDDRGEWLYYGPVNGDRLWRVATRDLNDPSLSSAALAARVEDFGPKPLSDGITIDAADTVYLSDPEHSAILTLGPDRRLRTLLKDARLRWPDGFSWGPDGWLYATCSSLHHVLFTTSSEMRAHAPYQIFRFRPGPRGTPGH
jgi:sugar lactone lactonase YvrE